MIINNTKSAQAERKIPQNSEPRVHVRILIKLKEKHKNVLLF